MQDDIHLVDELNAALEGSPYTLPDDDVGSSRANVIVERGAALLARYQDAHQIFAAQTEEIRSLLESVRAAQEIYETNALELAGMSRKETERAIRAAPSELDSLAAYMTGEALRSDKHLMEVIGMRRAGIFARDLVKSYRDGRNPIREIDLRSVHQLAVGYESFAGSYRATNVGISGSEHVPLDYLRVSEEMHQLVEWLNREHVNQALAAAVVHSWLTHIHPFQDGNGRVARLAATIVLLKADWPPLIIAAKDRLQYLDALGYSDSGGDLLPLFDLFVKSLKSTVRQLADPTRALRLWERQLALDDDDRYALWLQNLELFLEELRAELQLEEYSLLRVTFPVKEMVLLLEERDPTGNAWLAKVHDDQGDASSLLWLGYTTNEMDSYASGPLAAPSIFTSVRDYRASARRPYLNSFDDVNPLPLDEILILPTPRPEPVLLRYRTSVDAVSIAEAARQVASVLMHVEPLRDNPPSLRR
ncbi:MAG: Fic family protein [Acidimicrobiales bacterium]